MLNLKQENIPAVLKNTPTWVGFMITDEGKKIPIDPNPTANGQYARINKPTTWGTFEDAINAVAGGLCEAVGYALTKEAGLIFLDLDCHTNKCSSEEEKKQLEAQYKSLYTSVSHYDSYLEQSQSGMGVHLLAKGNLLEGIKSGSSAIAPVELYTENRFVIMTGHTLNEFGISDSSKTIRSIQDLQKAYFSPKEEVTLARTSEGNCPILTEEKFSSSEVLEVARRNNTFNLLWDNHWEQVKDQHGNPKYSEQHYADFALIRYLTFYTANCPTQVERLFRQSPCFEAYGKDGKWEKYDSDIQKDIQKASTTCRDVYTAAVASQVVGVAATQNQWKPPMMTIYKALEETDKDLQIFHNPKLIELMKDYIIKYNNQPNIRYTPYLFREDRNVNGATNIVRATFGDTLRYSRKLKGFYIWNYKKFVCYDDDELLIHPLTETLGLVEHSVFHWLVTIVAITENDKEHLEEEAVKLFLESKRYVEVKLANDVLKKYKGIDVANDISFYYESPYLNMANGVLDLQTMQLLPHSTIYNQYKITNCDYDPTADCPAFKDMMVRLLPDDDVRREFQKALGLCLAKEQLPAKKVLMLLVGPKDTGKTTVLNTVVDLLGDYATSIDNSLLMQSSKDKTRGPEMYDFRETLMITTSEANESDKLDTGRVKALTGETMQSVRNNYATAMDKFPMIGLIFMDSNHKPYIPPRETATWDRLRLFPFICPVLEKDTTLKEKLIAERAGIFNWMLQGLALVTEEKEIFETSAMQAYKDDYQSEVDITKQFLTECVQRTKHNGFKIVTTTLFTAYRNWCKENGFRDSVRNKFYEEVSKEFEKKKSGTECFIQIQFTSLGHLYSTMGELSSQQFAKDKKAILNESIAPTPYSDLCDMYISESNEWFIKNIQNAKEPINLNQAFVAYTNSCSHKGLVPVDFEAFFAACKTKFSKQSQ